MSYVDRHAQELLRRAKQEVDGGVWRNVTVGGDGKPGEIWQEVLTGARSNNMDLADSNGVELKFIRGTVGNLRLFHKNPPKWDYVLPLLFKAKGGQRWSHTVSKNNRQRLFQVVHENRQIILRPVAKWLIEAGVPDIAWPDRKIDEISSKKLSHVLLGRGIVRSNPTLDCIHPETKEPLPGKEVRFTGFHYLSDFVGGSDFVQRLKTGAVRIEFDAKGPRPDGKRGHDHGPKFTSLYTQRGDLWLSDTPYGECRPKEAGYRLNLSVPRGHQRIVLPNPAPLPPPASALETEDYDWVR